jgi:hypothetical protein
MLHTHVIADKQTFSKLDVVGWYTTGEDLTPHDMEVNKTVGGWRRWWW